MMPLVAILVVFGSFMFFDLSLSSSWTMIFSIIGAVVVAIGILGIFLIKDPEITPTQTGYFYNIFYGFRPRVIGQNGTLYMTLLAYSVFGIAINIFMPYLILYYTVSLGMDNYVLIFAPAIVLAADPPGTYSTPIGFKTFHILFPVASSTCCILPFGRWNLDSNESSGRIAKISVRAFPIPKIDFMVQCVIQFNYFLIVCKDSIFM